MIIDASYPHGSRAGLEAVCHAYDDVALRTLVILAWLSACASTVGLFRQFDDPGVTDLLLCFLIGLALWAIARVMWAGAWQLPNLQSKRSLIVFTLVATLGFGCYAAVSVTANLSATAGSTSRTLVQGENADGLAQAGQAASAYIGEMRVVREGLVEQADLARGSERAEIDGRGPTGIPGRGAVSNSFGAAAAKYDRAAALLQNILSQADDHVAAIQTSVEALRSAQIDPELSAAQKDARLKVLSGEALNELRALLALDPARTIRSAAADIATGVPNRSNVRATSQARIDEISASMRAYGARLNAEADRIAALLPGVPELVTLSTAERLVQTMWRTPAWTAAALLLDLCGWIAVGFRLALYNALSARIAAENANPVLDYVTLEDFKRVEAFVARAVETKQTVEAARIAPKRGRPPGSTSKAPKTPKPGPDGKNSDGDAL